MRASGRLMSVMAGLVAAGSLAGCGGGPRTEEDRVVAALQSHLNAPANCEHTKESVILPWETRDTAQDPTAKRLRAMANVELVSAKPTTTPYAGARVPATAYNSTGKLTVVKEGSVAMFTNTRFCFARKQVTDLADAVVADAQDAVVRFNYTYADAPKWTQDAEMQVQFPEIAAILASGGGVGTARLSRAGETWTVVEVS